VDGVTFQNIHGYNALYALEIYEYFTGDQNDPPGRGFIENKYSTDDASPASCFTHLYELYHKGNSCSV
jgi:hypothetical protein